MQLYLLTLWLIAATMAAPTKEPQPTEQSNQQVATAVVKQKLAKQLPIVDNFSYIIVAPVDASSELRREELALDESPDETIDHDVIVDTQNGGEMMHTAENLVFRPLFSYRKLQEKRNRIYGSKRPVTNNANTVRRSSYVYSRPPYYPTGYYYPY